MTSRSTVSVWTRIRIPLLITVVVLIARLVGELQDLGHPWTSTAGGGVAILGISWLIPVFGLWFGWKRTGERDAPDRPGLAMVLYFMALVIVIGVMTLGETWVKADYPGNLAGVGIAAVIGLIISWRAWPGLLTTLFVYALLARLLVIAVTVLAFQMDWGTHFEKVPERFRELDATDRMLLACGVQGVFWVPFTVGVAGLFACLASMIRGRRADDRPDD